MFLRRPGSCFCLAQCPVASHGFTLRTIGSFMTVASIFLAVFIVPTSRVLKSFDQRSISSYGVILLCGSMGILAVGDGMIATSLFWLTHAISTVAQSVHWHGALGTLHESRISNLFDIVLQKANRCGPIVDLWLAWLEVNGTANWSSRSWPVSVYGSQQFAACTDSVRARSPATGTSSRRCDRVARSPPARAGCAVSAGRRHPGTP